jgi:cytochrome P450
MTRPQVAIPNLVDPKTYAEHDMAEVWRKLRAEEPVFWHPPTAEGPGFWALTRYEDIMQVLRDDTRFTSERGNVLATMLSGGDTGAGRMLAVTDGSHHTALRKILLVAFSPRALAGVAQRVRETTRKLLLEALDRGQCDFAQDVASAIPLNTICDLLDIPVADRQEVLRLTKSALASDYSAPEQDADRMSRGAILVYFNELVEDRRKHPGSDPISIMANAEINGQQLDDVDIVLNCYSLIMGGDETSRLAMIGATKAFAEHPDQWAVLKAGAVSVESAGEEVLRWTTPTMHFGRSAVTDVTLYERVIGSGDLVTLWLVSGNHDETVFPQPDEFAIARSPNKHLALGYGRHFCLGAYLGRVEINTMLDGLRSLVGKIEQAAPERWIYSNFLNGMSSLPVALERDPRGVFQ